MHKEDLALNNQQWLICHKIKPNQTKPYNILPPNLEYLYSTLLMEPFFALKC